MIPVALGTQNGQIPRDRIQHRGEQRLAVGGKCGLFVTGTKIFCDDEKVPEMDSGDVCTTL